MMALAQSTCLGCGQNDDHPKHLVGLQDGSTAAWHMDCHARATDCATCSANVADKGDVKGSDFRKHIEDNRPFAQLMDEDGVINDA